MSISSDLKDRELRGATQKVRAKSIIEPFSSASKLNQFHSKLSICDTPLTVSSIENELGILGHLNEILILGMK